MEDVDGERLSPLRISYANMSVNRQLYSECQDVIWGMPGWGVARFLVKHVPSVVKGDDPNAKEFGFRPTHEPEDLNYAHTEIWAYKDGLRIMHPKPSTQVKKLYRQIMSDNSLVLVHPSI